MIGDGTPGNVVTEGDVVTVVLHNGLTEATALLFQGQAIPPDTTGAAPGGTATYTFTASKPGTFLYEAGFIADAVGGTEHQVAMGLYGALIVRPATAGQAYDTSPTASSAYNDEGVLVLGEIDTALNKLAAPASFDMRNFKAKYFTINGKAYSATDPINTTVADSTVLLRFVNAGMSYHSMGVLGGSQQVIAYDGNPLTYAHSVVAETYGPGQTVDALVSTAGMAPGSKLAVYDANLLLNNNTSTGFGGMLTFINVGTAVVGSDVTGPSTSGVTATPSPTNGSADVALAASLTDAASTVAAAEYFIDNSTGGVGTGIALSGTFGTPTVAVSGTILAATVNGLSSGTHTIYVRGQDSVGNWGSFSFVTLNVDKTGPTISLPTLTPNPSNGTAIVAVHATASDVASGGGSIAAAEYTIDGGAAVAMTVNNPLTVASIDANIAAATVNALVGSSHVVSIRAQDNQGNWSTPVTINLIVDKAGPVTSAVSASPTLTNGLVGFNSSVPAVRVFATATDGPANVAALEGFIDTLNPINGTGFVFFPADTGFNSPVESAYADIPLSSVLALSQGMHTVTVHGKDSLGNWGALTSTTFTFDNVAPTFTSINVSPTSILQGTSIVALNVVGASDGAGSGLAGGEYWFGTTNIAAGTGTAFALPSAPIATSSLAPGTYTVRVRIKDLAGNWSTAVRTATFTVVPEAIFVNGFDTGGRPWGWSSTSTNTTGRLNVTAAAAQAGTLGLQAQGNNTNYVQYNFGTAANPVTPTFDARFYFNPNGNTGTNTDIFVARASNGNTVFRVRYRWNGGSPQVQIQVGTGTGNTSWTNISNNTANPIEVVWQSGTTLQLYVNGALQQTLTATNTSIGQVRLGSVTSGGNAANGLMYFDTFASKRSVSPLYGV